MGNLLLGVVQTKVTLWLKFQDLKALTHKDLKDLLSSKSVTLIPRFFEPRRYLSLLSSIYGFLSRAPQSGAALGQRAF